MKHTEEAKRKIGLKHKGKKLSPDEIKRRGATRRERGWYRNPKEQIRIISLRNIGNSYAKGFKQSKELIERRTGGLRGKKKSEEHKNKIREARSKQIIIMKNSSIECKIQNMLKELHTNFLTQYYISDITHKYRCDIFIPKQEEINQKIVIECDGCYFHGCSICPNMKNTRVQEQILRDKIRTEELVSKGFKVIRLWEHQIKAMELNDLKVKL